VCYTDLVLVTGLQAISLNHQAKGCSHRIRMHCKNCVAAPLGMLRRIRCNMPQDSHSTSCALSCLVFIVIIEQSQVGKTVFQNSVGSWVLSCVVFGVWVRHSGGPLFRGSAIPGGRHSGCEPFGYGSVVHRVRGLKGHLSESFYSVNLLALLVYSGWH